jgi:hypothetical protein
MRSVLLGLLLLGSAGLARSAEGPKSCVLDEAGLFSKAYVAQAQREIAAIREEYGVDLVIETRKDLPPPTEEEKHAWFKGPARRKALRKWALERADELGVDGIYIVIFHGPASTQRAVSVVGWPEKWEDAKKVSWVKRDDLGKVLARELPRNRDDALLEVIAHFRAQVERIKQRKPSPLDTGPALVLVAGLVGAWLVLMLVRARLVRRSGEKDTPKPYQPAMMGALFGVPAAFWVHDQLFRALPPEAPPVSPVVARENPAAVAPAPETPPRQENPDDAPVI